MTVGPATLRIARLKQDSAYKSTTYQGVYYIALTYSRSKYAFNMPFIHPSNTENILLIFLSRY